MAHEFGQKAYVGGNSARRLEPPLRIFSHRGWRRKKGNSICLLQNPRSAPEHMVDFSSGERQTLCGTSQVVTPCTSRWRGGWGILWRRLWLLRRTACGLTLGWCEFPCGGGVVEQRNKGLNRRMMSGARVLQLGLKTNGVTFVMVPLLRFLEPNT
jgi:hypothetical protein